MNLNKLKTFEDYITGDSEYDSWPSDQSTQSKVKPKYEVIDSINMYLNQIKDKDLNKADIESLKSLQELLGSISKQIS